MTQQEEASRALVPADNAELVVRALHVAEEFSSAARYGGTEHRATRRLTWLTGNNEQYASNGKTPLPSARGWYLDRPSEEEDDLFPDDYALIDAMEVLIEQGLAREVIVVHQDEAGKPRRVPSWHLHHVSLFVVCEGIPDKTQMLRDPELRWGVAFAGWQQGGAKSTLMFSAFVKELLACGYTGAVQISVSSYLTDRMLACLEAQWYVLKFADSLRQEAGEQEPCPYYAYALPIGCSGKTITAGKEAGKTKELFYPVPTIPRLSKKDLPSALSYLAETAITRQWAELLEEDGRVERAVEWSIERSRKLLAGPEETANGNGGSSDSDVPF